MQNNNSNFFETKIFGHPAGLFTIFFTEMWERFSYYGMRALLVLFLTSSLEKFGWNWERENAMALYGSYTSLAYLTTMIGGYFADKYLGFRKAVLLGAFLMTCGHASMAVETPFFLYLGLALLVSGIGFFKPNMVSIVGSLYKDHQEKKDAAYSIFYMGVNSGAFLGTLVCGYVGEKISWSYGFGLAGIFMFFGMLYFYFAQNILGKVGLQPIKSEKNIAQNTDVLDTDKRNPFSTFDMVIISIIGIFGFTYVIYDPYSKISGNDFLGFNLMGMQANNLMIITAIDLLFFIIIKRISQYASITRDRMIAVSIFAFFTVFFWASFEQAGGSMTIFAKDYTNRTLEGSASVIFKIVNTLLSVVPLGIFTFVMFNLLKKTIKKYFVANIILPISFIILWGIVIFMNYREFSNTQTEIPASWFIILNALFIVTLSPFFSKFWEKRTQIPAAYKYAAGLTFLGLGFGVLAFGSSTIPVGAKTASVSLLFLVFAYFMHTLGELCLSPVGLSYVSKLVPARMLSLMYGIWYLAIAIGNKLAGKMGGSIDKISEEIGLSGFFLIFTLIPIVGGIILVFLMPFMKKLMHGIK